MPSTQHRMRPDIEMKFCYQALGISAVELHEAGEVYWPGEVERVTAPEDGVRLAIDLTAGPKKVERRLQRWLAGRAIAGSFALSVRVFLKKTPYRVSLTGSRRPLVQCE